MFFFNLFKGKKARVRAPKGSKKTTTRRRIWFGVEQLEDRLTPSGGTPITLSIIPGDTVGVPYNQSITASGGTGTITLTVSNIQNAVPGLNIPSSGTGSLNITGTPTAAGTETFTVTGTDGAGDTTGPVSYSITVNPATTVNPAITLSSTTQTLLVTSYVTNAVYEFDGGTGALLKTLVAPNSQSILSSPAAITVGPDGNLYITGEGFGGNDTYNITEYNFSTQTLSVFISGAQLQAANGGVPFAPGGIAFGPDGNLYTDNTIHPGVDQVLRLGITNNDGQLSYNGTSTTIAILPLTLACDITFGANPGDQGNLYVSDDNSVVKITGATTAAPTSSTFVSAGEGGLQDSCGVIWFGGDLYVTDPGGNQVLEYDANGTFIKVFTSSALQGQSPINTLFLPDGDAVISTFGSGTENNALVEFNSSGTFVKVLSSGAFPANPTTGVTGFTGAYMTFDTTAPAAESTVVLAQDTINAPYNQSITPNGGTGAVTLSVSNVQNTIPGLNITGNDTSSLSITGTPTATGTETFTVTATDSMGGTTTTNYTFTVNAAPTLSPGSLPADIINVAYNQSITGSGGTGSITLAVSNISNAIPGLNISGSGSTTGLSITGTPTAAGTETFTVTGTDGAGGTTGSVSYSITVNPTITLSSTTQAVFVTSYVTNAVYEFDANTGALLATLVAPNSQSILIGPASITVGPDGNLYIPGEGFGGNATYNICEYNFSTQTLSTFITGAQMQAANGGVPFAPGGIAFGPDGNLYTDNTLPGAGADQVIRFDIANQGGQLSYSGTSTTIAILPLTLACDIMFGANPGDQGNLYVSDDNSVVKITGATTASPSSSYFVSPGEGGLGDACGVIWHNGDLYVTDPGGNQVLEYDANGNFLGVFASLPGQTPINTLFLPDGDAVTSTFGSGRTAATLNGALKEFNSSGTFLQVLSSGAFPANASGVTNIAAAYMIFDMTAPATQSTVVLAQDTVNAPYNQTITPNGGTGAVTLTANVTNAINGLNITGNGTNSLSITGTPTATGTETFTVTATDSLGNTTTTDYTFTVNAAPTLSTSSLPADTVNVAYPNQTISTSGGTGAVTLTVSNISNAIPGLNITGSGTTTGLSITGTPTAAGTETFTVTGTDGAGGTTGPVSFSITVNPAITVNRPTAVPDSATTSMNTPVVLIPAANDSDPNGNNNLDLSSIAITTRPSNGFVSVSSSGAVTYTPDFGFVGTDTFAYTIADVHGGTSNPAVDTITVLGTAQVGSGVVFLPPQPPAPPPGTQTANATFVGGLYREILGSQPDAAGLSYWTGQLQNGVSRATVIQEIQNSTQYRTAEVTNYYQTYLQHAPDSAGLAFWVHDLEAGATEQQVVLSFLTSAEYLSVHSNSDLFVRTLYSAVLGRTADASGLSFWKTGLANGTVTDSQVAMSLLNSVEAQKVVVDAFYVAYLGRTADSSGESSWLNALQSNRATWDGVALGILTSSEYVNDLAAGIR